MTPAVLQFEFVAPGNSAPVPLAPDALWVDVGNGGDDAVLDHHQGGAADSAAAMVLGRAPLLLRRFGGLPAVRVTTHRRPDLDAVTACWLVSCLLRRGALPCGAAQLAAEVSRHDQGREGHHGDAASDLGLVMAVALEAAGDDLARLDAGFAVLDRVAGQMEAGVALDDAVAAAAGGELRGRLDQAARGFAADMAAAAWGRVALPGVADPVTVAHFVDPACPLLKHFFRRDHGDAVLAVSWTLAGGEWRHVISVQAECGLALPGLGAALEQAERKAEEGRTLRPGRERVQAGSGRFGGDVVSPWYDGRGHDFTIVDSPSVGAGETARCASLLSPARVWDVITSLYAVDKELPTP